MDYNNLSSYPFTPSSACGAEEGTKGVSAGKPSPGLTQTPNLNLIFPNRISILKKLIFAAGFGFLNQVQAPEVIQGRCPDARIVPGSFAHIPFML